MLPSHFAFFTFILLCYQCSLSLGTFQNEENGFQIFVLGLMNVVHSDQHEGNLIWQNKEGICSTIGYFCLHCLGSYFSQILRRSAAYCLRQAKQKAPDTRRTKIWLLGWWSSCLVLTFFIFLMMIFSSTVLEPPSRRACNLTYVLWMIAYHLTQCFWKISIQVDRFV